MVFLALGNPAKSASANATSAKDLVERVRVVATDLVARLEQAERLSDGWRNQLAADVLVDAALSEALVRLAETHCWGEANRVPSSELWRIAGPILEVGSLQRHARFKPHGYAGDHEMLARICEESCCEHPLGRIFDRYFLQQAAPAAVRARTRHTAATLATHFLGHPGGPYRVASVGAGPALDVCLALDALSAADRDAIEIRLLDLDPHALEAARQRLAPRLNGASLVCIRTNLYRLARNDRGANDLASPHFLVCAGLFDYLEDEAAAELLRFFWRQLAGGGLMLVGNFAPHNPSRAYMEWIGNWYLHYRNAEAMERLGESAGIPRRQFRVGCESTGVDLFLVAEK